MAQIRIVISRDGFDTNNPAYRIDCQQHGPVEKGYGKIITERANTHNSIEHHGSAIVDIPEELIPRKVI